MKQLILLLIVLGTLSCHPTRYGLSRVENKTMRVDASSVSSNTQLDALIAPYKRSMDSTMNDKIAYAPYDLDKKNPESLLGNWVTDGIKWYMDSVAKMPCDVAFCNYGGLRIKSLSKGDIKLKNIFELMPFDNAITLIELDESNLKLFLESMLTHGGWPMSRGLKIVVDDHNSIKSIQKTPIEKPVYTIAISDYIANGGDNMDLLAKLPHRNTTFKIRDILIEYARYQNILNAILDGRIFKEKK